MRLPRYLTHLGLASALLVGAAQASELTVGGKNYTEQLILSSMTRQYLDNLGYDIEKRDGMGSSVLRQAQENGQVDLYWEYTGTSLMVYNDIDETLPPDATYQRVKALDADKGIIWLKPSEANNTYALAMRDETAEAMDVDTLGDLSQAVNEDESLTFGLDTEFYSRQDGWRPLQQAYGFRVGRDDIVRMDTGLIYSALRDGNVDVGLVFSTDGRVPAFDFRILEANPALAEQLNTLSGLLDDATMAALNARVDVERETIERVAERFLEKHDLI